MASNIEDSHSDSFIAFALPESSAKSNRKTETILLCGLSITYVIGRNAKENFDIIDESSKKDMWFHIKNDSSCHVIALMPPDKLTKKSLHTIIKRGALICKQNSRFKSDKNVTIIYTHIENIAKTETVGLVMVNKHKEIIC